MFNLIINIISIFCRLDYIAHMTERVVLVTRITGVCGQKLITWAKHRQPEVIWSRNISPNYLEDILRNISSSHIPYQN